jgi:hypothetical protein
MDYVQDTITEQVRAHVSPELSYRSPWISPDSSKDLVGQRNSSQRFGREHRPSWPARCWQQLCALYRCALFALGRRKLSSRRVDRRTVFHAWKRVILRRPIPLLRITVFPLEARAFRPHNGAGMPRTCSLCARPDRGEVDSALRSTEPLRALAQRFTTSPGALCRHRAHHLRPQENPAAREPAPEQSHQVPHPDPPTVTADHTPPASKANLKAVSTDQQANTSPRTPCPKCGERSYRQMSDGRVVCVYCVKLPTY